MTHPDTEEVFHRVRSIESPTERLAYLETVCRGDGELRARVAALLAAEAEAGEFLRSSGEPDSPAARGEAPGAVLGRYEVLERIGEGGHGEVYLARPLTPGLPPVALKVLRAGMNVGQILTRFEAERRTLAIMEHPGIAKILDVGTTDAGRPYFAMERVDGESITSYADDHGLSIRERLALFRKVCQAVQHAHLKGVVHRDLKPSNILVTEVDGQALPKVIDFGIAKATAPEEGEDPATTREGSFLGTPQYMSPEQTGLSNDDVDTRADVYSLGVVLYELLTGTTPLDPARLRTAGIGEVQRLVDEARTPLPSRRFSGALELEAVTAARRSDVATLRRLLRRDLDWIVLKALERERDRRYQTVLELADDVQRFLDDAAVSARPPSAGYRLRKLAGRHRVAAFATLAVAAALVVAVAGTTIGLVSALEAKAELTVANDRKDRITQAQADRIREIDPQEMGDFIRGSLFGGTRPKGEQAALEALLQDVDFTSLARGVAETSIFEPTREAIDREFADQPLVQAKLLHTLGAARTELGLLAEAHEPLERALAIRRELLGDGDPLTLDSVAALARLLRLGGKPGAADPYYDQALAGRREALGEEHPSTIQSLSVSSVLAADEGDWDEADQGTQRAVELSERVQGPDHQVTLATLNNRGIALERTGDFRGAEAEYRKALDRLRASGSVDEVLDARLSTNLARALAQLGQGEEARELLRHALPVLRQALGEDHTDVRSVLNTMSILAFREGEYEEALDCAQQALDATLQAVDSHNEGTLMMMSNVGKLHRIVLQLTEAEEVGARALEAALSSLPPEHATTGGILVEYGRTLAALHRFDDAETVLLDGHAILHDVLGESHHRVVDAEQGLIGLYELWDETVPNEGHGESAAEWRARRPQ